MNAVPIFVSIFIIGIFPDIGHSFGTGPLGHPEITFSVATSDKFKMPTDLAKVLALGSAAPDFFEFENDIVHAMTPLEDKGRRLPATQDDFQQKREEAFHNSEKWCDFYLDGAVEEMKHGHREKAAFLLGYALHNRQDFSAHLGTTNLAHSGQNSNHNRIDENPERAMKAHNLTSFSIELFRESIGEENWLLFVGGTVRKPGEIGTTVPEPLSLLAKDLWDWNPSSGVIPPTPQSAPVLLLVDMELEKWSLSKPLYPTDISGHVGDSIRGRAKNFFFGFYTRQDILRQYLDIPRGAGDPQLPPLRGIHELENFLESAFLFEFELPRIYRDLDQEQRKLLDQLVWPTLLKKKVANLKSERESCLKSLLAVLQAETGNLAAARKKEQDKMERLEHENRKISSNKDKWDKFRNLAEIVPPHIDGRPKYESPSHSSETTRSSRGRSIDSPRSSKGESGRSSGDGCFTQTDPVTGGSMRVCPVR